MFLCHKTEYPDELKGTATLIITMFYMKDINKPLLLIPVPSKSVENVEVVGV